MNRIGFGPTYEVDRYALGGFRILVFFFCVILRRFACEMQAACPRSIIIELLPIRISYRVVFDAFCRVVSDTLSCRVVSDTLSCRVVSDAL